MAMARRSKKPEHVPYAAIPGLDVARAIHAWAKGEASPDEQRAAFAWIVKEACRAGKDNFVAGGSDVTAYLNGRLSVSLQIGWVLGQSLESFRSGELD